MTTYGPWKPTPRWLLWLGKPAYRRSVYASMMIGGGWDGWEFASHRPGCDYHCDQYSWECTCAITLHVGQPAGNIEDGA